MLVFHFPVTENLVLFVVHTCDNTFKISFTFKEDSSFTRFLMLVTGPANSPLEM